MAVSPRAVISVCSHEQPHISKGTMAWELPALDILNQGFGSDPARNKTMN